MTERAGPEPLFRCRHDILLSAYCDQCSGDRKYVGAAPMTTPTDAELRDLAEKAVLLKRAREAGGWQDAGVPEAVSLDAVQAVSALEAKMRDLSLVEDILALLDGKAAAERERDEAREAADIHWRDFARKTKEVNALRTSLTRAEADRDRYKALYDAERAALEAKFRAALPAQPKEGE